MFNIPQCRPSFLFDIIALIIDIVGENEDTNLKDLFWSLIPSSRSVANIYLPPLNRLELHDAFPRYHITSSKKGFLELLKKQTRCCSVCPQTLFVDTAQSMVFFERHPFIDYLMSWRSEISGLHLSCPKDFFRLSAPQSKSRLCKQ
jgi:hypothetical protein